MRILRSCQWQEKSTLGPRVADLSTRLGGQFWSDEIGALIIDATTRNIETMPKLEDEGLMGGVVELTTA